MAQAQSYSVYQDKLHNIVVSAENIKDLITILQAIPLQNLKSFVHTQISELNQASAKRTYFLSGPIDNDDMLPDDVLQYILSFEGLYNARSVNKKFNTLSQNNERIHFSKVYSSIDNTFALNTPWKFNKNTNSTWIVHATRNALNSVEIVLGFKGVLSTLHQTIELCEDKDRILIHNGSYSYKEGLSIDKSLQLIGIDTDVVIHDFDFCVIGNKDDYDDVYIENMRFDYSLSDASGSIHLSESCRLSMRNCRFRLPSGGIQINPKACLALENCEFERASTAIEISTRAKQVNIDNCIFSNCGNETPYEYKGEGSCISLESMIEYGSVIENKKNPFVYLKCVGNTFENNYGFPIAERHPYDEDGEEAHADEFYIIGTDRYELRDNVLSGFNGTEINVGVEVSHANKIYFNNQPEKMYDTQ